MYFIGPFIEYSLTQKPSKKNWRNVPFSEGMNKSFIWCAFFRLGFVYNWTRVTKLNYITIYRRVTFNLGVRDFFFVKHTRIVIICRLWLVSCNCNNFVMTHVIWVCNSVLIIYCYLININIINLSIVSTYKK